MPQTIVQLLVVEDAVAIAENIRELFGFQESADIKYDVTTSYDGQDAIDKMKESIPDLVILDIMLPVLNGYSVLEYIRGTEALMHVPVVILSALVDKAAIFKGFQLGANDYITKPFTVEELITRVQIQLAKSAESKRDQPQARPMPPAPAATTGTRSARPNIFVAYAAADGSGIGKEVIAYLEDHQFSGWWNKNIPAGSDWDDAIIDAINQADAMVIVMTIGARVSRYVRAEWRYALDEKKIPVIPLIMPGFEPAQLPLTLREIQWIDARVDFDAALEQLVETLRSIAKR